MKPKRPYSRAFPKRTANPKRYLLGNIPPTLWESAERRARAEGLSMRALLLSLLKGWVDRPADLEKTIGAGGS